MSHERRTTTSQPPRVRVTPSLTLTAEEARRRRAQAYRLLLGIDPWPGKRS